MRVPGQDGAFPQLEFRHEHVLAVNEGFTLDAFEGGLVTGIAVLVEHAPSVSAGTEAESANRFRSCGLSAVTIET